MAIIAKASGGVKVPILEEGIYTAVCTWLIDLGMQHSEKYNKDSQRVMVGLEIDGEKVEVSGETVPRVMWQEYTNSLHEKSLLRRDLQAWRGKAFTETELAGFDLKNILGVPCQVQVIHNKTASGEYANIAAVMAMPRGIERPKAVSLVYFDLSEPDTFDEFHKLPEFIRKKISLASNFNSCGLGEYLQKHPGNAPELDLDVVDDDDDGLPF